MRVRRSRNEVEVLGFEHGWLDKRVGLDINLAGALMAYGSESEGIIVDMTELREKRIRNATRVGLWGVGLLFIAYFAPYSGQEEGKSFFTLARESSWRNPGDWPAAWCSIKLILLALGVVCLIDCLARLTMIYRRETFSWLLSFLNLVPGAGLLLGFYYLVKAVL
jgi:hypothetical protein